MVWVCWCRVGSDVVTADSELDALTVVPLAMAMADPFTVAQFADQRQQSALLAALPVRSRNALKASFGRNRRPRRNTWRSPSVRYPWSLTSECALCKLGRAHGRI